jgi:hypothetical protein
MGKRAVLSVTCVPTKDSILVQAGKILPTVSPIYGINPSISQHCVGDILGKRKAVGEQNM